MKLVGLISGGKDSIYNLLQCIAAGHEVVAIANIEPYNKEELDSYMYQSVGHEAISLVAASLRLPIFRQATKGSAICKDKTYTVSENDEVEDMYILLNKVKKNIFIEGVAVGAIASDYQRTRVESVCERLGLKCFAYLWKRDQGELLEEMIHSGLDAIIVKVASIGLKPDFHLGAHIREVKNNLVELHKKYGVNICGEGGEYETLTLDCPLFTKVIKVIEYDNIVLTKDPFAPVGVLNIRNAVLKSKPVNKKDPILSQLTRLNHIQSNVRNPYFYIQDCLTDLSSYSSTSEEEAVKSSDKLMPDEVENLSAIDSKFGYQRALHSSKSKMSQKISPSSEAFSFDSTISNLNYSTGWYFLGNAIGATVTQSFASIQKHLSRIDFDFKDIIMVELFVRDLTDFASINSTYANFIPKVLPPVRVCVETCLPLEIGVLINVIAQKCISKSKKALTACLSPEKDVMHVQSISHWAPASIGPYSQCIRIGPVYYIAGQIPLVPGSMEILNESIFSQCKLALRHVLRIMEGMTPTLTYSNVLQAICYVTSEEVASLILPMWAYITENKNATVTSIIVSNLPRKAELEWQVIACTMDDPQVDEETEINDNYKIYMKRCVFKAALISSLVCKVSHVRKKQRQKSDINLKIEAVENLVSILRNGVKFLIANMQCPGVPLCMLKLFYKYDDAAITNVINEITKSTENCKVTASGIPVVACEEPDVFLTVTGICH